MRRDWNARLCTLLLAVPLAGAASGASAQGEEPVSLDRLLKIPSSAPVGPVEVEKKGGRTRSQWQERYRTVRKDLAEAERTLAETRAALEERMGSEGSQWKMAAPGIGDATAGNPDTPTDYRLSQQLRRDREELARAERALQDLDVEANLAGVPEDWRRDDGAAPEASGQARSVPAPAGSEQARPVPAPAGSEQARPAAQPRASE